ncbi:MAG: hypothetical protein AB7O88_17780 [Reyranellaceae bacterium]
MDDARLEAFLARLYTDAGFLDRFVAQPIDVARAAGLSEAQARSVAAMNMDDLRQAASGFRAKGARAMAASHGTTMRGHWRRWWRWRVRLPLLLSAWRMGLR